MRFTLAFVPVFLILALPACSGGPDDVPRSGRDPRRVAPLGDPALPNAYRVAPGLYRGAQPGPDGFRALRRMGIRTVLNLRSMHSDEDEMREAGVEGELGYVSVPMHAWHPEDEDVVAALRVLADPARRPVFVHCQHGADRTGVVIAAWRMAAQGWSAEEAIREMRGGGYGFHEVWADLPAYLERLDVERLRRETGFDRE